MLLDRYRESIDGLFKKVRDTQTENIIRQNIRIFVSLNYFVLMFNAGEKLF